MGGTSKRKAILFGMGEGSVNCQIPALDGMDEGFITKGYTTYQVVQILYMQPQYFDVFP